MNESILVVGSFNLDTVVIADKFPAPHTKMRARTIWQGPGGAATNTAAWLQRLGRQVRLASTLGAGDDADKALGRLVQIGIDVSGVERADHAPSRAVSIVTGVDKVIMTCPIGARVPAVDRLIPQLADAVHLHVATTPTEELGTLVAAARSAGLTTSLELAGRPWPGWTADLDRVFLNSDELERLVPGSRGAEYPAGLELAPGGALVVTRGSRGAAVLRPGVAAVSVGPPQVIDALDRTGGGDAFDAGYLEAWLKGQPSATALRAGLDVAARAISRPGGIPWD